MGENSVIILNRGVVLVEHDVFERILKSLTKKTLIDIFAYDLETQKTWKKLTKTELVSTIYIEYEW